MTAKPFLSLIASLFLLTISYTSHGQENINNTITFIQSDRSYKIIKSTDSIILERKPFTVRYFGKKYTDKESHAAQVAVLENPNDTATLSIGQNIDSIPYFSAGTGMAPGYNNMYDTVFITNTGCHYLYYESEKDKRVNLISKNKDILELEWKITAAHYEEKDFQFLDLPVSFLYFTVFIDDNLNGIIDKGELKIIKILFK